MQSSFKLAVGQTPAELATPSDRIDWLTEALPDLRQQAVDLLLLPEFFLTGYHIGDKVYERAEAAEGPSAEQIAALAERFGLAVHYGYAERADGVIYSAAQCFGPNGRRLGHHRKLAIPPGFEQTYYAAGGGCKLFSYCGLKIAPLICYDAEFAEPARHVASKGAQLVLVSTALSAQWGWVARSMIPTRAYENGVFLAYANHAGTENGLDYLGASFIAAPDGVELARAGDAPEILVADLDPARVARAQTRLPYVTDCRRLQLR
ncbi:MAG TPA: carbon-nitrogen hydrolase family protein [Kiloniellaceae bacterium]|nr:carbon-nitrogen hydrolase family protein [Kiloniellaceae bacterium]